MKNKNELVDRLKNCWTELYRPKTLEDLALNKVLYQFIKDAIDNKDFPNLLLYGEPGTGKNSIINVLTNEIDCNVLSVNCGSETGIDNIRENVEQFANTTSFGGKLKVVVLNEMDNISYAGQQALKEVMETTLHNCRFILTTNNYNKINPALISRCSEFNVYADRLEIVKRLIYIFEQENVSFDDSYITAILKKYGHNIRKMIGESYKYYKAYGDLKEEYIKDNVLTDEVKDCFDKIFKTKDVKKLNTIIKETIFDDNVYTLFNEYCIDRFNNPDIVPIIAEGNYRDRICNDKDLVFLSMILQVKEIIG